MKKRTKTLRHTFTLFLAAAVIGSGAPVYGAGEFTDGSSPEIEMGGFLPEETDEQKILSEEENREFLDRETAAFSDEETAVEDGIRYIKGRPLTDEERAAELAPFDNLKTLGEVPQVDSDLGISSYALYPPVFDSRKNGLVTVAKSQHPFGICWSFGLASIMETSFLAQNKGTIDLSEEHLAYFFSNRENDPLNNTAGDYNFNTQGYHQGGNDMLASIFLTTWSGMTTEKSVPLPTDASHSEDLSDKMVPPASKAYEAVAYLTDASFSDYSVDRMKEMVTENNAVAIMLKMNSSYYNPDTGGYCYPTVQKIDHVVTVVGWDDTYSKENFLEKSGVTSDGAWIVKNSWGPAWGENGYFYLSYEDKNISGLISAKASDKMSYPNNYFYDGSSGLKTTPLKKGQSVANVFTAKAKKGFMEAIGEVNAITYSDNSHYKLQIYTDLKDPGDPVSGKKAYSSPVDVYQPIAGVKTIKVPEVTVPYGSRYSVVLTNAGSDSLKVCVEADTEHSGWFKGHAEVEKGQGFFGSTTGTWTDLVTLKATPRLKVHTRTLDKIPAPALKGSVKGYNKISLSWNKISGVSGYYLYRSESGKAKKKIASLSSTAVSYSEDSLKTGVKYTYTLVPYVKVSGEIKKGTSSKAVSLTPVLGKPDFEVKVSANGYNTITWRKVTGATEYWIYRKTSSGKLSRIASVKSSSLSYKDSKITACASYAYAVRAVRKTSQGTLQSRYDTSQLRKAAPALQKVSSVKAESSGIRIKWKTQSKCDGYRIYRKTKSGSLKLIKTISSRSTSTYLDKTASKGVLYYYAVRATVKNPEGNVCSRYSLSSAVRRK